MMPLHDWARIRKNRVTQVGFSGSISRDPKEKQNRGLQSGHQEWTGSEHVQHDIVSRKRNGLRHEMARQGFLLLCTLLELIIAIVVIFTRSIISCHACGPQPGPITAVLYTRVISSLGRPHLFSLSAHEWTCRF